MYIGMANPTKAHKHGRDGSQKQVSGTEIDSLIERVISLISVYLQEEPSEHSMYKLTKFNYLNHNTMTQCTRTFIFCCLLYVSHDICEQSHWSRWNSTVAHDLLHRCSDGSSC